MEALVLIILFVVGAFLIARLIYVLPIILLVGVLMAATGAFSPAAHETASEQSATVAAQQSVTVADVPAPQRPSLVPHLVALLVLNVGAVGAVFLLRYKLRRQRRLAHSS